MRSAIPITIPISIEGEDAEAALDTGGIEELYVHEAVARHHGWLTTKTDGHSATTIPRVLRYQVGPAVFVSTTAIAWNADRMGDDRWKHRYILGLRFLMRFQTEFNFATRTVTLHPLESSPAFPYDRSQLLFFSPAEQAIVFRVLFGKYPGWLMWDSGVDELELERIRFDAFFPEHKSVPRFGSITAVNGGLRGRYSQLLTLDRLEISGIDYSSRDKAPAVIISNAPMRVVDSSEFLALFERASGRPVAGVLGEDLGGAQRILIDPTRGYLWRYDGRQ